MPLRRAMVILLLCAVLLPVTTASAQSQQEDTVRIWINWDVPLEFADMLEPLFVQRGYERTFNLGNAHLRVAVTDDDSAINSRWLYVPVVSFASTADTVSYADIQRYWAGDAAALNALSGNNTPMTLLVTDNTFEAIKAFLGEPASTTPIQRLPGDAIITELWNDRPNVWALIPFNNLTPRLKALHLDPNNNIFDADFREGVYPLQTNIGIIGEDWAVGRTIDALLAAGTWEGTNRNPDSLTRMVLSGVTALTRATAFAMEQNGITTPGDGILDFVDDADIFHTSNEVPFSVNCPFPDPNSGVIFCSDERYVELLEYIGLDVIELTGNHVNDYGPGALNFTLDIYDEVGLDYFGGGRNTEDARAALITEHNGNSVAFIGCNLPGPFGAWASDERAGAAQCNDVYLEDELGRLSRTVDVVVMTIQDYEYYRYDALGSQMDRMAQYVEWGADVVIGSHAHQPQGFEIIARNGQTDGFVHHGLGNLFFDQMASIATRQLFMDRVIIYDGQVIAVELFTGIIDNFCCPRPMTQTERVNFLNIIFEASRW
jgi:hypothetical protein